MKKEYLSIQSDINPENITPHSKQVRPDLIKSSKAEKQLDPVNVQDQVVSMQLGMQIEGNDSDSEYSFEGFSQEPRAEKHSPPHQSPEDTFSVDWNHWNSYHDIIRIIKLIPIVLE